MQFALVTSKGKKMNVHKIALKGDSTVVKSTQERMYESKKEQEKEILELQQRRQQEQDLIEAEGESDDEEEEEQ